MRVESDVEKNVSLSSDISSFRAKLLPRPDVESSLRLEASCTSSGFLFLDLLFAVIPELPNHFVNEV
jgi:hypothetical protein